MPDEPRPRVWPKRIAILVGVLAISYLVVSQLLARADGPVFVFAGGPFQTGEIIEFDDFDWTAADELHELELEIVGAERSRILWFSVDRGVPYVACDLDCVDGVLKRWPQEIADDDRVVVRIEGQRIEGRLIHVPHGSTEYTEAKVRRSEKYSGNDGGRAAAETAAHNTVVDVGESLTGRDQRAEPGDRLFRIAPRQAGEAG